jgi:hypothetical protein
LNEAAGSLWVFLAFLVGRRTISPRHQGPVCQVKPRKELFEAYDAVFFEEMKKVEGLTPAELTAFHELIKGLDGGFLEQSGYFHQGFDRYFKRRTWKWREYEDWSAVFEKMGEYPVNWIRKRDYQLTVRDVFWKMKVGELKAFLEDHGIAIPPKTKKDDLISLVQTVPNVKETAPWRAALEEQKDGEGYGLYALLMRTISVRAKNVDDARRRQDLRLSGFKLSLGFDEDRKFVELARSRNTNAVPPFFPGDCSWLAPIIPGF